MARALIVGRFQPYHLGHHEAVKKILAEVDELIIVIGSAQESYQKKNPFTAGERIEMISRALKKEKLFEKCFIVPVPDVNENALWTKRIKAYCPRFDVVYSNNPLVMELFNSAGVKVKKMVSNHAEIESVKVRKSMAEGKDWRSLVPKVVADYLDEIKAEKRIESILKEEKKE